MPNCNKGRTCFIFIRRPSLVLSSHIKLLGITSDNRMTFTKHFNKILERCNHKFYRLMILVNKKWGPCPTTILPIYKTMLRPIFKYGIVSTITVSESVINKIQKVQNSFTRLALRLPKYVSALLKYVKPRDSASLRSSVRQFENSITS